MRLAVYIVEKNPDVDDVVSKILPNNRWLSYNRLEGFPVATYCDTSRVNSFPKEIDASVLQIFQGGLVVVIVRLSPGIDNTYF